MSNTYLSMFDIIGPVMVGPSSSHTSGAATIAWMARQIFTGVPTSVKFVLYGSFAETYLGHGTDRALIGGILGYRPADVRIRNAYDYAKQNGLKVEFETDRVKDTGHPNTVDIILSNDEGHKLLIRGVSIGGGRVRIRRINSVEVDFSGEYSTLLIGHMDRTGTIAYITSLLAEHRVNIATLRLFREAKGQKAFTVIETDSAIPEELKEGILRNENVRSVDLIEI